MIGAGMASRDRKGFETTDAAFKDSGVADMDETSAHGLSPEQLEHLLGIATDEDGAEIGAQANGSPGELLRQRLDGTLPLSPEVISALPVLLGKLQKELLPLSGKSLRGALLDGDTDLASLQAIKDYGKRLATQQCSGPRHASAIAVYYAAIASALLLVAGCLHIPVQPQLAYSSVSIAKQQVGTCASDFIPRQRLEADSGLSPHRISVLSWNMYKQSRADWYSDFYRFSHAQHVLIQQEAYMDEGPISVLSNSPYHWTMTTAFVYRDNASGVLTASHKHAASHCALYTKEPLIQIPKSILISTYPIAGSHQTLLIANVHGVNFTLGMESYRQQFMALHQIIQNHQGPLILAGDFNSWRNERQAILDKLSEQLSLQQVTYHGHQRITIFGNPIDHVYYRGLEIIEASSPSVTSSDHNPLLVSFRVTQPQHTQYAKTP